ncbi:MAG: methyl-accepting chemotaxis protein [Desulfobulbus sp.]|nr:methyl-accepting chemotaxis protein [Desulfobulbus sp.]
MKNIRIGIKLLGGFLLSAVLILVVGLLSIVQQGKLADEAEQLGQEGLPAVEYILAIKSQSAAIASWSRTLLTSNITREQRENTHEQLTKARAAYNAAKEKFVKLSFMDQIRAEWQEFDANTTKWSQVTDQVVTLSKELIAMDMLRPETMEQHIMRFRVGHDALLFNLARLLATNTAFEGGTNDTACPLGRWLSNMDTANSDIMSLAREITPIHARLHRMAGEIKTLTSSGQITQAKELLEKQTIPAGEQLFGIIDKIAQVPANANEKYNKMGILLLQEGATYQANAFAALDKMVDVVNKYAENHIEATHAMAGRGRLLTIVCLVIGGVLAVFSGLILTWMITKPLVKGVDLAKAMASGDMTKTMDVDQKDEIGILAGSLNEMASYLRRTFSDINNGVLQVNESSTQLAVISNQMTDGASSTASRSNQVAAAAEEMSNNQNTIAAAMEQASTNVNMVATSTEEMNSTITEIASNSAKAKEITTMAVQQSRTASERVNELGKAADEINKVTEAITEISEQTNLLALNATIEAARAGEAGKGFAVVANEIKDLARQTATATLDIKNKIHGVQEATGITVREINEIGQVIADVDKIVATIAAAVEEQTATTREIAQNVQQASQGIMEVNENVAQSTTVIATIASDIAKVNTNANEINQASNQVKVRSEELANIADRLKGMMTKFKT